ncbi:uncharacterized protein LOC108211022 [Daucus carota subsp. sativus]|uniref:Uncharacterized protein n=1 Tax=Daucus carota subsp. sativus TaxID=79200 RepID=A0A166BBE6_DAUCS|nr:PREDICTED: uncharacterized protein LOC108211022 [Daucus carota subsp. sativus]
MYIYSPLSLSPISFSLSLPVCFNPEELPSSNPKRALIVWICREIKERETKMKRCAYNNSSSNNSNAAYGCSGGSGGVVCPKPRRVRLLNLSNFQVENSDSRGGSDLLDMILSKGSYGAEKSNNQIPSSPPFFMGSPPTRATNPVVQDAHFGTDKPGSFSPAEASPSSQRKNGGCSRGKFGQTPAAVRIEGFNCGNCSVSAVA